MSGIRSRRKGKTGELQAAKFLRNLGFTARRAQQYSGTESSADLIVEELPNLHIECKLRNDIGIHSQSLKDAMEQAIRDCGDGGKVPVVLWRKTRGQWALTFTDWGWLTTVTESQACNYWLRYLNDLGERAERETEMMERQAGRGEG
jgi:Holliday junction resolvase